MIEGLTVKFLDTKIIKTPGIKQLIKKKLFNWDDIPLNTLIWGSHGTGKTFSAQQILTILHQEHSLGFYKYITLGDLFIELHTLDWAAKAWYRKKLARIYDLLVIDEIDKIKPTEWTEEVMFNIYDGRINNMMKTITIGNKNIDQLDQQFGKNICSRILTECLLIEMKGKVLR